MSPRPIDNRHQWTAPRRASVRVFDDRYDTEDLLQPFPWRETLVRQYPDLLRRKGPGGSNRAARLTVGDGWRETVEILFERLASIVQAGPVAIVRIFENCGSLRADTWADDAVDPGVLMHVDYAIALAEARSACTCEQCGCEGQLLLRWLDARHSLCPTRGR